MHRRIAVPLALLALVTSVPACVDDSTAAIDERVLPPTQRISGGTIR